MAGTTLQTDGNFDPAQIKRYGLLFGLTGGLVELLIMYGSYYISLDTFLSVKVIARLIPFVIILLLFGARSLRQKRGGYLTLKEGLQFAFLAYVIVELIYAAGTYFLYNVIDPELTRKSLVLGEERTRVMLEKLNTPKIEIEEEVAKIRKGSQTTSLKQIVYGMGYELIFDFLKSMIIAFLMKRERKTAD